jgi:hypothetical protein
MEITRTFRSIGRSSLSTRSAIRPFASQTSANRPYSIAIQCTYLQIGSVFSNSRKSVFQRSNGETLSASYAASHAAGDAAGHRYLRKNHPANSLSGARHREPDKPLNAKLATFFRIQEIGLPIAGCLRSAAEQGLAP